MKISVIMPCYLGYYEGCAKDRELKFERAVESFLSQDYENSELIIVSDGCGITNNIVLEKFRDERIKLISISKQVLFSGNVRQAGIEDCNGDIICYLDSDDVFENKNHLSVIVTEFNGVSWVYFNDFIQWNPYSKGEREVKLEKGSIGTSNIAHRNISQISWIEMNGYGHDWTFIESLIKNYPVYKKINGTSYKVCHIPHTVDV